MITNGLTDSFLWEILQGIHQPTDEYRVALYTRNANLGPATTAYVTEGEAQGQGYKAGGQALLGRGAALDRRVALIDFADPVWPNSRITARAALIFNFTRQNRAVTVVDLGEDFTSTNGSFTITWPEPTAEAGLIRIGSV